jgi:hypothetical protein
MTDSITLNYETADRIAVLSLKDAFNYMQTEIAEIEQLIQESLDVPDYKMEDYVHNKRLCEAIRMVLHYYGETV